MTDDIHLAELLCARFCHDLAGPIGAVNNGIEFLSEEDFAMKDQAVSLIDASAKEAVARLQFLRMAYGVVKQVGGADIAQMKQLTENMLAQSKVTLDWPDQYTDAAGVSISNKLGRVIFNMIIITTGSLIYGGQLSVRLRKKDGHKYVTVSVEGEKVKFSDEQAGLLKAKAAIEELDSRNVQIFYTGKLAKEIDAKLSLRWDEGSMEMTATSAVK